VSEHAASTHQVTTPSDREIALTRAFDAPRGLVFEAWTRPEHVRHWWGWRTSTMIHCAIDLRVGGAWRYVTREADGSEVPVTGVYQEITPPERLVYTEVYDVEPFNQGEAAVTTVTFDEVGGRTTVTSTTRFPSSEVRDGVLASGMEAGAAESMDRLAERLKAMA
jgi:uncharacterized protein YndB with AHSA1/START domain